MLLPDRSSSALTADHSILNWKLRPGPTVVLVLAGLLLPNLLSIATLFSVIDIGLPPRPASIFLYVALLVCARRLPFAVTAGLFVLVLAHDLACTLSLMFGLAPSELFSALRFAARIQILSSPLYVAMIGVLIATSGATLWLLRDRARVLAGDLRVVIGGALALMAADYFANTSPYYEFGSWVNRDEPVVSALEVSDFGTSAVRNGRNVVFVMVESFGYLTDPAVRDAVSSPLNEPAIREKYTVTSGKSGYFGSTTAGELRELCDTRVSYEDIDSALAEGCLPARLKRHGYATLAFHGYTGTMFDRTHWYPKIGFSKAVFGEDMLPKTKRMCGSAFHGACDNDLTQIISAEAAAAKKPKFIYWLTLNTHVPVALGEAEADFDCAGDQTLFRRRGVCRMGELWRDVFQSVAKLALDPNIGPAEILIVGDHAPPLWSKAGRQMFEPGQVAWYRLTPRSSVEHAAGAPDVTASGSASAN